MAAKSEPAPGSVSAVRYTHGRPAVLKVNDSETLAGLRCAVGPGEDGDATVGGGTGSVSEHSAG